MLPLGHCIPAKNDVGHHYPCTQGHLSLKGAAECRPVILHLHESLRYSTISSSFVNHCSIINVPPSLWIDVYAKWVNVMSQITVHGVRGVGHWCVFWDEIILKVFAEWEGLILLCNCKIPLVWYVVFINMYELNNLTLSGASLVSFIVILLLQRTIHVMRLWHN